MNLSFFKTSVFLFSLVATLLFSGCNSPKTNEDTLAVNTSHVEMNAKIPFVQTIEKAAHKDAFSNFQNVQFHLQLSFGGKPRMDSKITMATNSTRIKIEEKDGKVILYDGEQGYMAPDTAEVKKAGFDLFTWPYFFAFPYKLSDSGTKWSTFSGTDSLAGKQYDVKKLSFEKNTGASPDDWYVVYRDRETNLVAYAAYIVTLNRSREEAEKNPHVIYYSDYRLVDGIPIAHQWTFYSWDAQKGLGKELGKAKISHIAFSNDKSETYTIPENAKLIQ